MTATSFSYWRQAWRSGSPLALTRGLWLHRHLILSYSRREIEGRYRGNTLGLLWMVITPLAMLLAYTFVFGVVFRARWPHVEGTHSLATFAVIMFAGQIVFGLFSEPVGRSSSLVTSVPNLVKKVVFPLEILAISSVIVAAFHFLVSYTLLLLAAFWVLGSVPAAAALIPILMLPTLAWSLGISWFLSGLGVYIRDTGPVVGVILQILFFATPVFYPASAIPAEFRHYMEWNPLTLQVEWLRNAIVLGSLPAWESWGFALALSTCAAYIGRVWFLCVRKGFADVL